VKKLITLIMICIITVCGVSAAYARDIKTDRMIVTSGLDFEKERISTFDSSRTLSGTTQKNDVFTVEVYSITDNGFELYSSYDISVGISGIFSKKIEFEVGENYVVITDCNDDIIAEIVVNRKSKDIKRVLEEGMYLP